MGMFLKTIVAFCVGAGMLIGAQHLWMSSITQQIRIATARQALPQTQLKPAFNVDGDKLRHRITPLGANEIRVSLTFEYVTDPGMRPWWRFISNMKDAVAYFGFRQLIRGRKGGI